MAKVEIDEEELLAHNKRAQVLTQIMADDEAALLAERAFKKVNPNAQTPRLDAFEKRNKPTEDLRKEVEDLKKQRDADKAEREQNEKITSLRQKWDAGIAELKRDGWTAEGIAAVEKIRDEKGILDPIDAAAIYERHNPPATPVTPNSHGGAWDFMSVPQDDANKDLNALIASKGDNSQLLDKMIGDGLKEARQPQPQRR